MKLNRYALISVSDKGGLVELATALERAGMKLLSTGGSASFLRDAGLSVTQVHDFTGSPEICEGRVKSLHPKIHGAILARRDRPRDLEELAAIGGGQIDAVVVNLYPFGAQLDQLVASGENRDLIEFIDIGGPALLRAAAKNWRFVTVIPSPEDYGDVIAELNASGVVGEMTRRRLATKVFSLTAAYDGEVARYLSLDEKPLNEKGEVIPLAAVESMTYVREMELRYGENPHQSAALYRRVSHRRGERSWKKLQGKELSFNNLVDLQAALELLLALEGLGEEAAVIVKHMNPCGVALGASGLQAFERARACDPVSAFGGIVVLRGAVSRAMAESVTEGFVEIVSAEDYSPDALEVLGSRKNIRVIQSDNALLRQSLPPITVREFCGDIILQTRDDRAAAVGEWQIVCGAELVGRLRPDLDLSWRICKFVKSNAIVIVKDGQAIGIGAGQMSRVDSARLAVDRARRNNFDPRGGVAASDAFLPFPDTLEVLAEAGVVALVQPGGSLRDREVIEVAEHRGVGMVMTGERHFRH